MVIARAIALRMLFAAAVVVAFGLSSTPASAQAAAGTYKAKCAMCHGADGKGDTPMGKRLGIHDFASEDVKKQSDADLANVIAKGKNKMPGYEKSLKEAEIKDLVTYIRGLGK